MPDPDKVQRAMNLMQEAMALLTEGGYSAESKAYAGEETEEEEAMEQNPPASGRDGRAQAYDRQRKIVRKAMKEEG